MAITTKHITLTDPARSREIPLKIYEPKDTLDAHPALDAGSSETPCRARGVPTVIFSHGLGGSCESYQYLGEFFASHGLRSIHPTHIGIDAALLKEKRPFQVLKEAAEQQINLINPPLDIKFILDEMQLDAVALAGHSFGSYTTLALSGQNLSGFVADHNFTDARVKCAIAISPHAVLSSPAAAYEKIVIPVLHVTGKFDDSPFRQLDPADRRIPYDNILADDQYLIIFTHADHMVFAAQRRGNKFSAHDVSIMKITCAASLEFLKKYLLGVHSELDSAEFFAKVSAHGIFENKLSTSSSS